MDDERTSTGPSSGRPEARLIDDYRAIRGVYALADPRTGRVMYVGQSMDVEYRYRQHCRPREFRESNRAKAAWVNELAEVGLAPKLLIVVDCGRDRATGISPEMDAAEVSTIRAYKVLGEAEFNISPGGRAVAAARSANSHPDDWYQLGLDIKRARALLHEISHEARRIAGKKEYRDLYAVMTHLDRAKVGVEMAMRRAYPEWQHVSRVFSGPPDATPAVGDAATGGLDGSDIPATNAP